MRPVRVVTLNLWNDRPDVTARLRVAIDGLRGLSPDLVTLQEVVEGGSLGNQAGLIARELGLEWCFDSVDARRDGGPLGNAVLSRFPIRMNASVALPSAPEDPRRALLCHVETPMGLLPIVSCHLSWEMWLSPRREAQVVALDDFVKSHPADLPPIVAGDFNASPDTAAIRFLTGRTSLAGRGTYYRDAWLRRHPHADGYTWSDKNPYAVRWIERNRRIDYIFIGPIHPTGWGAVLDARVVLDLPGPDGVFASDHFAVYAELGEATPETAV